MLDGICHDAVVRVRRYRGAVSQPRGIPLPQHRARRKAQAAPDPRHRRACPFAYPAGQPAGGTEGRSQGPAQHARQRPLADRLRLEVGWSAYGRDRGLPPGVRNTPTLLQEVHPGEVLLEDCIQPMGISVRQHVADIDVPPRRISELMNAQRPVTSRYRASARDVLRHGAPFWLNRQSECGTRVPAGGRAPSSRRGAVAFNGLRREQPLLLLRLTAGWAPPRARRGSGIDLSGSRQPGR